MEFVNQPDLTWSLESYRITRQEDGESVTIRACLSVATPSRTPNKIRIQMDYESDDLPRLSEDDCALRLLQLLSGRIP
jgi:hypothetical protein